MAKETAKKKSALSILDQYASEVRVEFETTGLAVLDQLWGGGIDIQGMYGLWGPPGSGKTTLVMQILKKWCKEGKHCTFLDVEKAFNTNQQTDYGLREYVENGMLRVLTCSNYEEFENILEAVAESETRLFAIDSETMIRVVATRDIRVTDNQPGLKAKQSNHCLNKMKDIYFAAKIPVIVLFHARAELDMTGGSKSDIKQAGGFAAGHIPDVLTKVVAGARVMEGDERIGQVIRIETLKNKYTAPFVKVEKKLIYGTGISPRIDLIDSALEAGVITQGGAGYYKLPDGESIRGTKALYAIPNEQLKRIKELMQ